MPRCGLHRLDAYFHEWGVSLHVFLWFCGVSSVKWLTAWSLVLDVNDPLQGTTHYSHLTRAAVAVAIGSAHGVGRLRTDFEALAHWLVVLDHTRRPMIARLIEARAWCVEIWRPTSQEIQSRVRGMTSDRRGTGGEVIKKRLEKGLRLERV